ncbi:hypothetical protein [Pontivivens ytuae]|uniref:Rap1a immunity protein domain-containing protein n=1 Tax=Pontivivens ytuae TaxID=2789856 RepID=A0A7S9LT14_9RHOB|nr:hypothetical protein [Pontivivens ytuae]QPH54749.1 hypothetical protein I0K15_02930 [Pontivivens ytuae]
MKALFGIALTYPQLVQADDFTSASVLSWEDSAQDSFFRTSIVMTNIVASQTGQHDHIMTCINGWYETQALQAERHQQIRTVMAQYPDLHPQAIILAVIQDACGSFGEE